MAAFVLPTILIGVACGVTSTDSRFIYKMDQKVNGSGFFSSFQDITADNLLLKNLGYGAGSSNVESTLYAQKQAKYDDNTQQYYDINERNILFKETVDQAYGEKIFNMGKSFRSTFATLGKEETCIKNFEDGATGVSMNALFDSTSALSKDLSVNLYWKWLTSSTKGDVEQPYSEDQTGITKLDVNAAFTGKGHVGATEARNSVQDVNTLIDEDYQGTFSLTKKMSHEFRHTHVEEVEDWLPCCSSSGGNGGWDSMNYYDQKGFGKSTKGVFDCTCFKVPTQAQFQRVYS